MNCIFIVNNIFVLKFEYEKNFETNCLNVTTVKLFCLSSAASAL